MTEISEICETAFKLTYHPIYRGSLFIHLFVSISSIIPLIYFVIFKLPKTSFHGNLKFLFSAYFVSVFLFSVDFAIISFRKSYIYAVDGHEGIPAWLPDLAKIKPFLNFQSFISGIFATAIFADRPTVQIYTTEILIPLFSKHPCNLLIPDQYLKIGNTTVSIFMSLSTFFPISITIERFIAMKMARTYEKTRVRLGPILTGCNILLDLLIVFFIYRDEKFDDGSISFVFFPKTLAPKMFTFFWVMFFLNLINFTFNSYLLRQSIRLKVSTSSLATKYQREEVVHSTKFAVFVVFCHVILFGFYVIGIMILRYFGSIFIPDPADLMATRGAFTTMISLYNLVVGSVAVYLNHLIKTRKSEEITGTVRIQATGAVGAQNYENAIFNIWNSV